MENEKTVIYKNITLMKTYTVKLYKCKCTGLVKHIEGNETATCNNCKKEYEL